MKKVLFTMIAASLMTCILQQASFSADIQNPTPTNFKNIGMEQGKRNHDGIFKELNLTPEQSKKAKELREQSRGQIKPLIDQFRTEKQKYKELADSKASNNELKAQKLKVQKLKEQIKTIQKQNLANFEMILTHEQKANFEKIREKRMEDLKKFRKEHAGEFKKYHGENSKMNFDK